MSAQQTPPESTKGNVMNTPRRSITYGIFAMLFVAMAIPAFNVEASPAPTASPSQNATPRSMRVIKAVYHSEAELSGIDCIGDGASCVGYLNGTQGEVDVTNNTNQHYYWRFKLTCEFGGDKYSDDNPPSTGTVKSVLYCDFNAPAKYWNVLVDYK
jgi:hypothetical protein